MKKKNSLFSQVKKFCLSGIMGVGTAYLLLFVLTHVVGLWYVASSVIAFVANYSINFVLQKFWTFQNTDLASARRQIVQYFSMGVIFLPLNSGGLYLFVEFAHTHYLVAQVIITIVLSILSFFITKRIFQKGRGKV